jgi:peptidoglycan-associated lipoprotein
MSRFSYSCLALVSVVAAAGCHHKAALPPPAPPPAAAASTAPVNPPAPGPEPARAAQATSGPLSEEELFRRKTLDELNAERPLSDAFFDYDAYQLRDDQRTALEKDAAWLKKWPQTVVTIEGHCDDRGTAEYNVALGSRRATAVIAYLQGLGISSSRLKMTSLGKEAPFCHEDGESCWSQNRRGHFVITAK